MDTESRWSKSGYRLNMQGLVSPYPAPIKAFWRDNGEHEGATAAAALSGGRLQATGVLLGDTAYGSEPFR